LDRPPHGKERLISVAMLRMTLSQSVFQLAILFFFSWGGSMLNQYCHGCNIWGNECCDENNWDADDTCMLRKNTIIFNTFVFCQFWNEINCRKIKELNVFEGYFDSWMFSAVLLFTLLLQFIMVEFGSSGVGTNGLNGWQWLFCIVVGLGSIPVGVVARLIPIAGLETRFDYGPDFFDEVEEEEEAELNDGNVDAPVSAEDLKPQSSNPLPPKIMGVSDSRQCCGSEGGNNRNDSAWCQA